MPSAGFLADRLAKASAVPAEQRSADVRAFIETCRLQVELAEELGLTELFDDEAFEDVLDRWSAAPALRLVRTHLLGPVGAPLVSAPALHVAATNILYAHTSWRDTETLPSDLGHEWAELLKGDPSLEMFATLAAGLPGVKKDRGWERGADTCILVSGIVPVCAQHML